MKKLIPFLLIMVACHGSNHDGNYVNHTQGQFSITDDTLEVRDTLLLKHSSFQRIHNGQLLPKEYQTKQLFGLQPQFKGDHLILNNTIYEKL